MKFTIITEISNDLAAVINAMVIILLMDVDKCYAEQKSSELLDQSICNASCENKKEIMSDKYFKVVDLLHQDPFIKRATLGRKIYPKSCDSNAEMRKKENSNSLNGTNQDDKIKNVVNDTISNIYSTKEITSCLQDKTNELRGKIIITSNNRIEKMPTSVEKCNRLKKKETFILLKTDNKQEETMSHFKPTNSKSVTTLTDETLLTGNEHRYVIRKIRQIDPAQATLTFINDRNHKTFYNKTAVNLPNSDNNNLFITQDDKANDNLKIVKDASNYSDRMERIINKSPNLDLNEANFITMDEKRPIMYYYKSTRPAETNKSTSPPKFSDEALKRSKATLNYIIKKHNNKKSDRKRKSTNNNKFWLRDKNEKKNWNSTENYEAMQKIPDINKTKSNIESNDLMLKIVNKIQNYYKSYETKSMLLGKSNGIRHKLPYARTLQYNGRDLFPFFRFFSSPQKYEITNRFKNIQDIIDYKLKLKTKRFNNSRSTRASSDLYYIKLAKKVFGTANNQYDTTTPLVILLKEPDKPLNIFDENEADDDDDLVLSAAAISGMYNSQNDCNNDNDNVYNYYTHAITNENNVNNVILINMRTTSPKTTTTTPTTTVRHTNYPDVQVIKEEFPMDHNLLIAIIFTSSIILVFTTCCCAPIVLIKKQNECIDTEGKTTSSATSSSDSEDSTISYHCKSYA